MSNRLLDGTVRMKWPQNARQRGVLAACLLLAGGVGATTGVWTLKNLSDNYTSFSTGANWQDGYVPTQSGDSVELQTAAGNTNDGQWMYGQAGSGAIFGNITLPSATPIRTPSSR